MVFNRGMEDFVHGVLSKAGQKYMDRFSKIFERHALSLLAKTPYELFDESALRKMLGNGIQLPDAVLALDGANLIVEAKAGLFDESVMVVGQSDILLHKTRALFSAVQQAWSAAVAIHNCEFASAKLRAASKYYLLVVTNKEVSASRGELLKKMYPEGKLDYPSLEAASLLPLTHVYFISVDNFEWFTTASATTNFNAQTFLEACVSDDDNPATAAYYFEQKLKIHKAPHEQTALISNAIDSAIERMEGAFHSDK